MNFFVHKLGCPKNDVDGDYIVARLVEAGHTPVARPEDADSIIVNTCGFIQDAKQQSIDALLELGQLKKEGRLKTLYAAGCLSQRYGDDLLKGIEELDGAFGLGALDPLAEAVTTSAKLKRVVRQEVRKLAYLDWRSRSVTDAFPYSYLKISDGCDRECSYCAIPLMRGQFRSRPVESIRREAEFLAEQGKKEIILVSQEATLWNSDHQSKIGLLELLDKLEAVDGIEWIRLMYLHPARTDEALVARLAAGGKTLDYFDLPLQHINTEVLRKMKRETNRRTIEALLKRIARMAPAATRRVGLMVGFPGETEEQFEELYDFVADQRFERLGVFAFSSEEGTRAADLPGKVPEKVKLERVDRLMLLQQEIAFERNDSLIGNIVEVIIDSVDGDESAVGRSRGDCPEVDQTVLVKSKIANVGDICRVRIDASDGYDLVGCLVRE